MRYGNTLNLAVSFPNPPAIGDGQKLPLCHPPNYCIFSNLKPPTCISGLPWRWAVGPIRHDAWQSPEPIPDSSFPSGHRRWPEISLAYTCNFRLSVLPETQKWTVTLNLLLIPFYWPLEHPWLILSWFRLSPWPPARWAHRRWSLLFSLKLEIGWPAQSVLTPNSGRIRLRATARSSPIPLPILSTIFVLYHLHPQGKFRH